MDFRVQITGDENLWGEKGTWKKMDFGAQIAGNENLWREKGTWKKSILGNKLQEMKICDVQIF